MYGRLPIVYDVILYRDQGDGTLYAIDGLNRYVRGLRSPGPTRRNEHYRSVEEVERWYAELVTVLAAEAGGRYVAVIHWQSNDLPDRTVVHSVGQYRS